ELHDLEGFVANRPPLGLERGGKGEAPGIDDRRIADQRLRRLDMCDRPGERMAGLDRPAPAPRPEPAGGAEHGHPPVTHRSFPSPAEFWRFPLQIDETAMKSWRTGGLRRRRGRSPASARGR